ncbi:MAG TPA: glycerophosphodiester phosphodiesterase [Xanthobacteraceae bacterium]|nr:glycerophosphodiester phosphodiesterase [Xanthobacteraceae bacterium]
MRAPDWLIARPVAHRGLHDRARGILENMPAAIDAAVAGNFTIEFDLQLTADGEAMVHHDDELGRLTHGSGPLRAKSAAELRSVAFKDTHERMMSLSDLCDRVAGRVPLLIELKSHFDGDRKLAARVANVLAGYRGPAAVMSFDPDQVLAIRELMPDVPRGITAERFYDDEEWAPLGEERRHGMTALRHAFRTQPHFVAYRVADLPAPAPWIARNIFRCPLLTWTVRTSEQRARAAKYADQMIFEGFVP